MGRKTMESIPEKYFPLKGRDNMIISKDYLQIMAKFPGVYAAPNPQQGLDWAKQYYDKIWVSGGGEIYKELLTQCDFLYLTEILGEHPADTFFPEFEKLFRLVETIKEGISKNRLPGEYMGMSTVYKINKYERIT